MPHTDLGRYPSVLEKLKLRLVKVYGGVQEKRKEKKNEDLGKDIKKLGFGLMRLPKKGDAIDVEQVKKMVDRFLEEGFTYFDTAWAYDGSEDAIRQALVERYPRRNSCWPPKMRPGGAARRGKRRRPSLTPR